MSILWVRFKERAGGIGEHGLRNFHTKYLVNSSIPNETRSNVLNCGLLPIYGGPHPEDATALCVKVDCRQRDGAPHYWDAEAEWNALTKQRRDVREDQKQPDERRAKWRYQFVPMPQALLKDLEGEKLVDKAGTPISPPLMYNLYVDQITVTRFEATLNRSFHRSFLNAVNSDRWNDADPDTAIVDDISAEEVFLQGAYWFQVTYVLLVSPKIIIPGGGVSGGFNPVYILNAGPNELLGDPPKRTPIKEGSHALGRSLPLDEQGKKIDTTGAWNPVYLQFRNRTPKPFYSLQLTPPWS